MVGSGVQGTHSKGSVRARAKHAAPSLPYQQWQATRRKFACGATAVAMAGMLAMPLPAWAADWVEIDSTHYDAAASGTGSGGGTWAWDGANDLTLDDFVGDSIWVQGDLTVNLAGDNVVDNSAGAGIGVLNGDLVIQGDSSDGADSLTAGGVGDSALATYDTAAPDDNFSITIDDATVDATTTNGFDDTGAIHADGDVNITSSTVTASATGEALGAVVSEFGDITIDGSKVTATQSVTRGIGSGASGAIFAWDGSVNIVNGSDVTATASNTSNGTTHGIYAKIETPGYEGGVVTIADSTVKASATCEAAPEWGRGIGAFSNEDGKAPSIVIDHSTVEASGSGFALLSWSRGIDEAGAITITNSKVASPAGAAVQDVAYSIPGERNPFAGQTLGTGTGTITALDSADIVKDVAVEATALPPDPDPDPTPVPTPSAVATLGVSAAMVQTGDGTAAAAGVAAAVGAAALVAAGVSLARRREQ